MLLSVLIPILLAAYSVWAFKKILTKKRKSSGRCSDCPYYRTGLCGDETKKHTVTETDS